MATTIAPPSYHTAVMSATSKGGIDMNIDTCKEHDNNYQQREEKEEFMFGSLNGDYSKGFPENHYMAWTAMRVALMIIGIPIGIRKSRRIRCHGHGGSCGLYNQDRPCSRTIRRAGPCCRSRRRYQERSSCCTSKYNRRCE